MPTAEILRVLALILLLAATQYPTWAGDHPDLDTLAGEFIDAAPYQRQPLESLQRELRDGLTGDPESVFLPGSRLAPLTRALLKLQATDGAISPARYRIRYGQVQIPNPPKADPMTVSLVQVDRFNLGPTLLAELEAQHGAEHVRADSFADDPHLSWRFVMRPVMGTTAMTAAAARAEIPAVFAEIMDCLGTPCIATSAAGSGLEWESEQAPAIDFEADYVIKREGIPSPAAMVDLLLAESHAATRNDGIVWHGFEMREGIADGAAFVDLVIETGLGQDSQISGILRDDHLMDHETRTHWIRLRAVATAPDQPPHADLARTFKRWR